MLSRYSLLAIWLTAFAAPISALPTWLCNGEIDQVRMTADGCVPKHAPITTTKLSPKEIVSGLNELTQKAQSLQPSAQEISASNAALVVVGGGPVGELINGYSDIVTRSFTFIQSLSGTSKVVNSGDADDVYTAYSTFTKVNEFTLHILNAKADATAEVAMARQPMSAILRQTTSVYDTLGFTLTDLVPSQAGAIQGAASKLGEELDRTIKSYSGRVRKSPR